MELRGDEVPYPVVKPYSTWESDSSSVVQEIVAEVVVMFVEVILDMTGGVKSLDTVIVI